MLGAFLALTLTAGASAETADDSAGLEAMRALDERYDAAIQAGVWSEAESAAAGYISTLLNQPDYDPRDWARGLIRLADAQRGGERLTEAIQNYEQAAAVFAEANDHLDVSLIEPVLLAGETLAADFRFADAAERLEQALHLQQVNFGLHNLEQRETLAMLASVYLRLGDQERARARQQAATALVDRAYPGDDLRRLPALLAEAEVLIATGHLYDAHMLYRRTVSMVERTTGSRVSPEVLEPLIQMAEMLAFHDIDDGYLGWWKARRHFKRAMHIADHNPDVTTLQRADTYIAYGDFHAMHTKDFEGAVDYYREAWQILASDPSLADEIEERFGQPTLLTELPPRTVPHMHILLEKVTMLEPVPDRVVRVRYDIDELGVPTNIEVLEGDPAGYWSSIVAEHVALFMYRPKIVDGEPVVVEDLYWEIPWMLHGYNDDDLSG